MTAGDLTLSNSVQCDYIIFSPDLQAISIRFQLLSKKIVVFVFFVAVFYTSQLIFYTFFLGKIFVANLINTPHVSSPTLSSRVRKLLLILVHYVNAFFLFEPQHLVVVDFSQCFFLYSLLLLLYFAVHNRSQERLVLLIFPIRQQLQL